MIMRCFYVLDNGKAVWILEVFSGVIDRYRREMHSKNHAGGTGDKKDPVFSHVHPLPKKQNAAEAFLHVKLKVLGSTHVMPSCTTKPRRRTFTQTLLATLPTERLSSE